MQISTMLKIKEKIQNFEAWFKFYPLALGSLQDFYTHRLNFKKEAPIRFFLYTTFTKASYKLDEVLDRYIRPFLKKNRYGWSGTSLKKSRFNPLSTVLLHLCFGRYVWFIDHSYGRSRLFANANQVDVFDADATEVEMSALYVWWTETRPKRARPKELLDIDSQIQKNRELRNYMSDMSFMTSVTSLSEDSLALLLKQGEMEEVYNDKCELEDMVMLYRLIHVAHELNRW